MSNGFINDTKEFYTGLFSKYGDSPKSCAFSTETSREFRFKQLLNVGDVTHSTILDIGCGTGALFAYIEKNDFKIQSYTGIDICPEMIELAKRKYKKAIFECRNITKKRLEKTYDYVLMNAIFNNSFGDNFENMKMILSHAFRVCKEGMAFNFISSIVNFREDTMAYYEPSEVLEFCMSNLSKKINMFHHYKKCDVSVFVYKH